MLFYIVGRPIPEFSSDKKYAELKEYNQKKLSAVLKDTTYKIFIEYDQAKSYAESISIHGRRHISPGHVAPLFAVELDSAPASDLINEEIKTKRFTSQTIQECKHFVSYYEVDSLENFEILHAEFTNSPLETVYFNTRNHSCSVC